MKRTLFAASVIALSAAAWMPTVSMAHGGGVVSGAVPVRVDYERQPYAPYARHGYLWVPGHWEWHRHGYVWVPGSWIARDGRGHWERGHWPRDDRDYDGIPNFRDRDRDGDGVPNRFDRRPDNPRRW